MEKVLLQNFLQYLTIRFFGLLKMRHAARVPRDQDRADRGGILHRAAQQPRLQPPVGIEVAEKPPREDDRDILVGGAKVEEEARAHVLDIRKVARGNI